jgi:hypothetical protein
MSRYKVQKGRTVDDWVDTVRPHLHDTVAALRALIKDTIPRVREGIKWGYPWYALRGYICYLSATDDHVTFGLYRGAELADPNGLLRGDGATMRYVHVQSLGDIDIDQFRIWLEEAEVLDGIAD